MADRSTTCVAVRVLAEIPETTSINTCVLSACATRPTVGSGRETGIIPKLSRLCQVVVTRSEGSVLSSLVPKIVTSTGFVHIVRLPPKVDGLARPGESETASQRFRPVVMVIDATEVTVTATSSR